MTDVTQDPAPAVQRVPPSSASAIERFQAALRYEYVRFRTLRSTPRILVALMMVAIASGLSLGYDTVGVNTEMARDAVLVDATLGAPLLLMPIVGLVVALQGAAAAVHDLQYGTAAVTLLSVPDRLAGLCARMAVIAAWGGTLTAVVAVVSLLVSPLWPGSTALSAVDAGTVAAVIGVVYITSLYGIIGVALGVILRSMAFAGLTLVLYPIVVEPVITFGLGWGPFTSIAWTGALLPSQASRAVIDSVFDAAVGPVLGAVIFTAWTVVVGIIGALRYQRLDVT